MTDVYLSFALSSPFLALCALCSLWLATLSPRSTWPLVGDSVSQLPKGPAPKKSAGANPFARYKQRYFEGDNASGAPFIHTIVGLFLVGYTIDCKPQAGGGGFIERRTGLLTRSWIVVILSDNMHLKHHKK